MCPLICPVIIWDNTWLYVDIRIEVLMFPRYSWLKDPVNFSVSNSYLGPDLVKQLFRFQKKAAYTRTREIESHGYRWSTLGEEDPGQR